MKTILKTISFFSFACIFNFVNAQVSLNNGLTAFYPFDNDTKNYATANNSAAIDNNAVFTSGRNTASSHSLNFNGTTWTTLPINFDLTNSTVSFWFKPTSSSNPNTIQRLFVIANLKSGKQHFSINYNLNGNKRIDVRAEGEPTGSFLLTGNADLNINQWHHVVVSCKYGGPSPLRFDVSLSVNNNFQGTGSFSHNPVIPEHCFLGKFGPTSPQAFIGQLDELLIYNRELNQSEITAIYNGSLPSKATNLNPVFEPKIAEIFPNPNQGNLYITFNSMIENGDVSILNLEGKTVWHDIFENQDKLYYSLDIPNGIYTILLNTAEGIETKKLIISK